MEKYHNGKEWIWEGESFPRFIYNAAPLESLYYKFGQLKMVAAFLDEESWSELTLNVMADEALFTSAIEGEILQRSSVRSSVNKLLKLGLEDEYGATPQSDALVEVLIDAKNNRDVLTKERLMAWHTALFPTGRSGMKEICVGAYRRGEEDMRIVSGPWEKEKVHYVAPPARDVGRLMDGFLSWLNVEDMDPIYKAIVAHLYFVLIHPFDDGNGRIARAITDYVLARADLASGNFYTISSAIFKMRREYYAVLDSVCRRTDQDIDAWVKWFAKVIESSLDDALKRVETVKIKVKFWDKHRDTPLNDRQRKVISKMLSVLPEEFEGGMRVKKYMSITKATRITAGRDLADLVEKGVMKHFGKGRGGYYLLNLDEMGKIEQ